VTALVELQFTFRPYVYPLNHSHTHFGHINKSCGQYVYTLEPCNYKVRP